jgi:molybdopterin-containing oxidoreductase family iron-sulfur binding subunit
VKGNDTRDTKLDLGALRQGLRPQSGREYWRGLEELAETQEFRDFLEQEFPQHAENFGQAVNRRQVLQVMGASMAMAGLTACAPPVHKIVPFVSPPEQMIPGQPLYYATAFPQNGIAGGILVESNMGRPTKIEGNPEHPGSLGATDTATQASILDLYDPDRSSSVAHLGLISSWVSFLAMLTGERNAAKANQGERLRILTGTVTSPTLADQLNGLLKGLPRARWHQYDPAGADNVRAGARLAFGEAVDTSYRFDQAEVILALEADFLRAGPGTLRYTREYARKRRERLDQGEVNRLYVAESTPSTTGAMAEHRAMVRACEMESLVRALLDPAGAHPAHGAFLQAVRADLERHRGRSIVLAGPEQPAIVHALVHQLNAQLGNAGKTVIYTAPVEASPVDQAQSLKELAEDMHAGRVDLLFVLGGNPVYNAPADLGFREAIRKVRQAIHLGLYQDETAELSHWHVPEAHYLETWSDTRAFDGAVTIQQPLIAPLYGGKSAHEVLAAFESAPRNGYDIVRDYWRRQKPGAEFESWWRKALHDGVIPGSEAPVKNVAFKGPLPPASPAPTPGLEITFRPDPYLGDGRQSNNGWLMELPRPLSKMTWDNPAYIAPATAQRLDLQNGDVVELEAGGRKMRLPVWIQPGQTPDSITLHLGFGRWRAGRIGTGAGFNTYQLRTSAAPWFVTGAQLTKTGGTYRLAPTHNHHSMVERDLVRVGSVEEYRKHGGKLEDVTHHLSVEKLSFYPEWKYDGYAWGMAVDLTSCVGCNACVIACQAENNIPTVGKDQVIAQREMHWIRIDRYYRGTVDDPDTVFQPVMCQHCESAPCELVCPVNATVHGPEGLNEMVYNRCVGTRYCSNNCPYKVRRFNFFAYTDWSTPSLKLLRNPNVTVRSRGVMEKCTYCVQRINRARIEAEKQERKIKDGEVITACQAACPAEAIVFGDVNDPASRVAKLKKHNLNYALLEELNTRPRTSYLARLRNPNPELPERSRKDV